MRVILDTSALFYPAAMRRLRDEREIEAVVLPTVVLLERARQLQALGRDGLSDMLRLAEAGEWKVEDYGRVEVVRTISRAPAGAAWRRLARDAMIAGHVGADDALWTANAADFRALGLGAGQLLDVRTL